MMQVLKKAHWKKESDATSKQDVLGLGILASHRRGSTHVNVQGRGRRSQFFLFLKSLQEDEDENRGK